MVLYAKQSEQLWFRSFFSFFHGFHLFDICPSFLCFFHVSTLDMFFHSVLHVLVSLHLVHFFLRDQERTLATVDLKRLMREESKTGKVRSRSG